MADADVLDQVTKNVPWLIIPATILTATPKLLEIWQGVAGTRDKRKALEIERARLENLKLLIEIEGLRKEHGVELPEVVSLPNLLSSGGLPATREGVIPTKPKKPWGWFAWLGKKWPRFVPAMATCLSLASIWLALLVVFGIIAGGIATWFDPHPEPDERFSYAMGATLGGLIPAMILLQIGYSLKNQRRLLKLSEQN